MRIPDDIKKYLKTKYLDIVTKWLLATLLVATLVVFCNESFHYIPTGAKVVIYTIILLIPALDCVFVILQTSPLCFFIFASL